MTDDILKKELARLDKEFGTGTVMRIGDNPEVKNKDIIPTGSIYLDAALGVGGYVRGRIIEILGWESSGKTTIATHAIAEAQKIGLTAALIDVEHAFDPIYAASIGVDVDNLLLSQPMSAEEGLEVCDGLTKTGKVGIIVVDSVAALVPQKELDGMMGDSSIGIQSRLMGQAMRKLTALADKTNTLIIFINQIREKIGVMFGSPETTAGGNALRFYASVRIDVRKSIDMANELNKTTVKIIKNKLSPPFKKVKLDIVWGKGIDRQREILDVAVERDIIHKAGSWYSHENNKIGQGEATVFELFESNPEWYNQIEHEVLESLKKTPLQIENKVDEKA